MSLPSDVTVDNLKDFYAMILPYLNVGNGGTSDTPLGQVAFFDDVVAPAGWLIADGSTYNIADYPDLATQYERVHGSKNFYGGNGTTTFAVPDWDAIPAEVFGNANIICVKAVPSSEMNTYSTTERRVGTWIDGKPVYQNSFIGSWSIPWNNANMKGVLTGITPLVADAHITSARGYNESGICCDIFIQDSSGSWSFFVANSCVLTVVTLQYIKTTD